MRTQGKDLNRKAESGSPVEAPPLGFVSSDFRFVFLCGSAAQREIVSDFRFSPYGSSQ